MGDHPEWLVGLLRGPARAAVIANSCDAYPRGQAAAVQRRAAAVQLEVDALEELGIASDELDLRDYFGQKERLGVELERHQLVWVRGGNTFVLRHAMAESGADALLTDLLARDALVYAGYSAGVCVLAPSLRGLELIDDPGAVQATYGGPARWDGLGLLPYAVVPHYRSPGHPETEAAERLAENYEAAGLPHRELRDGQAIVIDGAAETVV